MKFSRGGLFGFVAIRFLKQVIAREAVCSLIKKPSDRENYRILLGHLNVCLAVVESVVQDKTLLFISLGFK